MGSFPPVPQGLRAYAGHDPGAGAGRPFRPKRSFAVDPRTFDRLVVAAARPSRRAALRLLVGGLLGGALAGRGAANAAQVESDMDGDGLYDDDEAMIYGTSPFLADTDGDGLDDATEIYRGTDPRTATTAAEACPGGGTDCGEYCADLSADFAHCGRCGNLCPDGTMCIDGACQGQNCAAGQTSCVTYCADLANDSFNCGRCGAACPDGAACVGGFCEQAPPREPPAQAVVCTPAETDCGGYCAHLQYSYYNCGACGHVCERPSDKCIEGVCRTYFEGCGGYLESCTPPGNSCCGDLICISVEGGGYCSPRP